MMLTVALLLGFEKTLVNVVSESDLRIMMCLYELERQREPHI